ncbi:hypothetical protein BTT_61820 (plasmid) [Bacillus thuringiensis serovar morrisoni str. 4AA1]|uniref:DUF4064 domain-containing protein n=1 Tax=Bacillus TaxID=1386 RepID=UPI0005CE38EE|nr:MULTISPECIES: DUF4064 domain-containing protein [Bacillus]AJQ62525.1 membrane protein [Bacillus thuringiensis serovar morrisoni]MED3102530.1 DUF4064 domain-containing protein [Bacillus thuringiensis]MRB00048.1 DUF4064 domain-containing protein [Bacillus thuringiensis]OTY30570.1 hypothetical protein BK736_26580 [Bacillus thuringiensis serovar poloniensis]RNG12994.1 DUF4064 domain-containing protein [Bacillus thuringiensis]
MKRTTEFILGLLGGTFGILFSVFALFIDNMSSTLKTESINGLFGFNLGSIFISAIGIIGCVIVKFKAKIGGILMTTAAIGGFICISLFYLLPGTLLLISGLMGIFRKEKPKLFVL